MNDATHGQMITEKWQKMIVVCDRINIKLDSLHELNSPGSHEHILIIIIKWINDRNTDTVQLGFHSRLMLFTLTKFPQLSVYMQAYN